MERIQWIALAGSVVFFCFILWNIRKRRLSEAYALLWLLFALLFGVVSVWPWLMEHVSAFLGIYYPPAMLFLVMLLGIILILFQYLVLLTKNREKIHRLSQEISLLHAEIDELKKKTMKNKKKDE